MNILITIITSAIVAIIISKYQNKKFLKIVTNGIAQNIVASTNQRSANNEISGREGSGGNYMLDVSPNEIWTRTDIADLLNVEYPTPTGEHSSEKFVEGLPLELPTIAPTKRKNFGIYL